MKKKNILVELENVTVTRITPHFVIFQFGFRWNTFQIVVLEIAILGTTQQWDHSDVLL